MRPRLLFTSGDKAPKIPWAVLCNDAPPLLQLRGVTVGLLKEPKRDGTLPGEVEDVSRWGVNDVSL